MIILEVEQGSPEWFAAKLGKPSASNASKIITNEGKPSKQAEGYLYELAAEIVTGEREEDYKNGVMEMGNAREEESRNLYELTYDFTVKKVGLIYKDESKRILCSPDGLIPATNKSVSRWSHGLELKNVLGKTQVKRLLDGELPSDYFSQIQFSLYVTGLPFWDFFSYRPKMRPLHVRVQRDEKFIGALDLELQKFLKLLDEVTEKIK